MKPVFPDFRNILTTGNVVSVLSAVTIAATAWANVQTDIKQQGKDIARIDDDNRKEQSTINTIQQDVAVIKNEQNNQAKSLARIEEWMRQLSRRNDVNK